MLRRVTRFLSTVVVVLVAAIVPSAVFATNARAAEQCVAKPAGAAPNGSHWYYQVNRVTDRKCWFLGPKFLGANKTAIRNVAPRSMFELRDANALVERTTTVGCIAAPNGQAPRSKRWYYRTDSATGQRCWRLSAQLSKDGDIIPARSPGPVQLVAPVTPTLAFPQAAARAQARLTDTVIESPRRAENASSAQAVAGKGSIKNPATSTFASRWINSSDPSASSDRQTGSAGNVRMDQPIPAVFDDITHSSKARSRQFTAEPPYDMTLVVLLASFGGALVLFGLIGGSFLSERSTPPVRMIFLPRRDVNVPGMKLPILSGSHSAPDAMREIIGFRRRA